MIVITVAIQMSMAELPQASRNILYADYSHLIVLFFCDRWFGYSFKLLCTFYADADWYRSRCSGGWGTGGVGATGDAVHIHWLLEEATQKVTIPA